MPTRHQSSRPRKSKNTTNWLLTSSENSPKGGEKDGISRGASRANTRVAKTSSTATTCNAFKPGPVEPAMKVLRHRKVSYSLTAAQVLLIKNAARHAIHLGLPFNRAITIDWELGGINDAQKAQTSFFKLLRDWLTRWGQATAYVWVLERGEVMGIHSHVLIYVPPQHIPRLSRLQRGWLKRVGVVTKKGVIHSSPIGHTSHAAMSSDSGTDASYRQNLDTVIAYILKAADSKARCHHRLPKTPKYSLVTGKRVGTSRNVGAAAIRKYAGTP